MINESSTHVGLLSNQRGAIVLLTVTLLLVIVSLVTLYTGKIQSFENKIVINEQNQILAKAKSDEGLQRVVALINADKALVKTITNTALLSDQHTSVDGSVELLSDNRKLISLTSVGTSPDELASAETQEQLLLYPLIFNVPTSAITVQGGIVNKGEIEVVANPDGLGVGKPLSIWSNEPAEFLSSNHHTCLKYEFDLGSCSSAALSNAIGKASDIVDSSISFPVSLSEFLFNIETEDLDELKSEANFVFTGCEQLNDASYGFLWIEGDCELDFNVKVGAPTQPVVLVVMNGHINMLDNAIIYGLVCSFRSHDSEKSLSVNMHPGALISGSLISSHSLGIDNVVTRVIYDPQVASSLVIIDSLLMLAKVPGSWRNF